MTTYQMIEETATTDANGYLTIDFPSAIDKVVVSASAPAAGINVGVISATAEVTGAKRATVRVWITEADWNVKAADNEQVTVTAIAGNG